MSSNAFARSRPRVRHQRMPRGSSSYDHPRFLQLVNELARINDLKRKQEEAILGGPSSSGCSNDDCNDDGGGSSIGVEGPCFSINQSTAASICCNPSTLNGYRSLDNNQPTPALQDNYHHQHQQQHHHHLHHHQQQPNLHQHHHGLEHHQQAHQQPNYSHHNHQMQQPSDLQSISNSNLQQNRCQVVGEQNISKSSSTSFGYSKQNLVVQQQQQHSSDVSTNNSDLRQDENRSKRKRTGFDSSAASSSASSTSLAANSRKVSSCGATSKRHKSSSDTTRPLSPSFTKCPICLLDCVDRDPSFTNTCFHLFCYVCIENWTKNKTSCPLCRTKFTKIIFNIKSATVYDEKTASPIRRDDDEGYIADRLMIEHLPGINPSSTISNRNTNNDDVQFLFENLRNAEVLMPPYFVNQLDPRQQEPLHSFNTITATTNFNSNVPHPQFTPTSYTLTPNYIALFPPSRIAQPTTNTAIASAYGANTSLTSTINNNDPNINRPRTSRSGRYIYTRNYDFPGHDGPTTRVSRSSNNPTTVTLPAVAEVRHQHHHHHHHQPHQHQQQQHQSHHHQHHHHHINQHRSTLEMNSSSTQNQQSQHAHIPLPYPYPPNSYPRRPFNSSQVEQQLLDNLYRNMPDM